MQEDERDMREALRVATEKGAAPPLLPIGIAMMGGILRDECAALYYRVWDKVPISEQGNI